MRLKIGRQRVTDHPLCLALRRALGVNRQSRDIRADRPALFRFKYNRKMRCCHLLHSGILQDAIAEAPSIVAMHRDPDFFAGLGMNEESMRTFPGSFLNEP